MSTSWRLRVLGRYSIDRDGEPVLYLGERKEEELLALLIVDGDKPQSRDRIAVTMWPDTDLKVSRKYLSYHLFILKQRVAEIGLPDFILDAGSRALRISPKISVDAWEFDEAVGTAAADPTQISALERALSVYGGGLLSDLPFPWLEEKREAYARRYALALSVFEEVVQPSAIRKELIERLPPTAWSGEPRIRRVQSPQELAGELADFVAEAEAGLWTGERREWVKRLDEAAPRLAALFERAKEIGQTGPALDVASRLWRYWVLTGEVSAGRQMVQELFTNTEGGSIVRRARAHHALGMLSSHEGDHVSARGHLESELALWQVAQDSEGILVALTGLGTVQHNAGDFTAAAATYDQAISIARTIDDPISLLNLLYNRALTALKMGDAAAAKTLLSDRLELLEDHPDVNREGATHSNLAAACLMEGDDEAARRHAELALDALEAHGEAGGISERIHAHQVLGRVYQRAGDFDAAADHYQKGLDLARGLKNLLQAGISARFLALAVRDQGDGARAERLAEEARQLLRGAGALEELERFETAWVDEDASTPSR